MKKILIISLAIISFVSCNKTTDTNGDIKNQIKEKKELIDKTKKEIVDLKKQLSLEEENNTVPVRVKKMIPEVFNHFIEITGVVDAENIANVSPEIGGQIKQIHVKEGDRVTKGQLLITLNTDVTKKGIDELKTGLELATTMFEKQESLWEQKIGSEIQFLQAKNAKESLEGKLETLEAQLEMSKIKAPFNGIIDEIFSKKGELSGPAMPLLRIVDLDKLLINADVSESYLPAIKKGDEVIVSFSSFPDIIDTVKVFRTGNYVKAANRTFKIQLKMDNKGEALKPNIVSILKIKDYSLDSALVVPSLIIKKDIKGDYDGNFVFIATEKEGKLIAKKVYVKVGRSFKDKTVIEAGIEPNQSVIVEGYNLVSNKKEIEIKN